MRQGAAIIPGGVRPRVLGFTAEDTRRIHARCNPHAALERRECHANRRASHVGSCRLLCLVVKGRTRRGGAGRQTLGSPPGPPRPGGSTSRRGHDEARGGDDDAAHVGHGSARARSVRRRCRCREDARRRPQEGEHAHHPGAARGGRAKAGRAAREGAKEGATREDLPWRAAPDDDERRDHEGLLVRCDGRRDRPRRDGGRRRADLARPVADDGPGRDPRLLRQPELGVQPAAAEVRGRAPWPRCGEREQPRPVHRGRAPGHAHLPRIGLLRDRAAPVRREAAQRSAPDPAARLRPGEQGHRRERREHDQPGPDPLPRPDDHRAARSPGPDQVHEQALHRRRRRPLHPGGHVHHGLGRGPEDIERGGLRSADAGLRDVHAEPRDPPPARWAHAVDLGRDAAPVDHARRRGDAVSEGRERQQRAGHAGPGRRLADVLLHEPAERAPHVLPRPFVRHHAAQRVRRRGGRLPHPGPGGEGPPRRRAHPRRADPPHRPGQELRRRLDDPGDRPDLELGHGRSGRERVSDAAHR